MGKSPHTTKLNDWNQWQTPRWKTAITRRKKGNHEQYSTPMAIAIQQGIIDHNHTVLDYGCGKGGDLRRLQAEGYRANGFDPYWSPQDAVSGATDVSLIYVLNVIENPEERDELLKAAFNLCDRHLLIAVRIDNAHPHEEITRIRTFQKYYSDEELLSILERVLGHQATLHQLKSGVVVAVHRTRLTVIPGASAQPSKSTPKRRAQTQQLSLNLRLVA